MFVKSNCAFEFLNPETGEKKYIPKDYIGDLPDWVKKTQLYKMATTLNKGCYGLETAYPQSSDNTPKMSSEEYELRCKAKAANIENSDKLSIIELIEAMKDSEINRHNELLAKAKELKIEKYKEMNNEELLTAIANAEQKE